MRNSRDVKIREAETRDLTWVNRQYQEVGFLPSTLLGELIVIAAVNGENAGLGRMKEIGADEVELGGIYALPRFRGHGVAREVVIAIGAWEFSCIGKQRSTSLFEANDIF